MCLRCRTHGFDPWVKKIPRRRERQPTQVFLPGESHGWRSLVGYSPGARKEADKTEQLTRSLFTLLHLRKVIFKTDFPWLHLSGVETEQTVALH